MPKVISDLLTNVNSGSPSLLLSLDISAVFDTLNHKRFLQRAQDLFCFTSQPILLLKSYSSFNRSFVTMVASKSNIITHSTGVPQGYVLGSLLFSIFTTPIGFLYLVLASCTTSMLTTLGIA